MIGIIIALTLRMVNGLHTASKGMMLLQDKMDAVSNNLANANTTGFKKALLVSEAEVTHPRNDEYLLRQEEEQKFTENYISFEQGPMIPTEDAFDLAIEGDGFFMLDTPQGIKFTRNGSMSLNTLGELVNLNGFNVLDSSGNPIKLDEKVMAVNDNGMIQSGKASLGKIGLVKFDPEIRMVPSGYGTFTPLEQGAEFKEASGSRIKQGYLEGSNVNSIDSMVRMIRFSRNFESNSKAIQAIDDTLSKAVNEIGKVN